MKRREFLHSAAALGAAALPIYAIAQGDPFDPVPGRWRSFEITTTVTLPPGKDAKAWIPIPSYRESSWMTPGTTRWEAGDGHVALAWEDRWKAGMAYAELPASAQPRRVAVISAVSSRDRRVDLAKPDPVQPLSADEVALYTAPTKFIPTDGLVKQRADQIVAGASDDLEKARRIYNWVVENTFRKPATRGCGLGNVEFLLQTGDLGGKCADINGLTVGLARAAGLPARDLYGVRVAPSRFGYHSLGANSATITKAQHCRAEVFLANYGWVPMDPADVRKVMLEEPPGNLPANNPKVVDARETLFGAWEGNYAAYNDGSDIALPGSANDPVPFLMYPQAEIGGERQDSLDPSSFAYEISVREIP